MVKDFFVQPGRQRSFGRMASRMSVAEQDKLEQRLHAVGLEIMHGRIDGAAAFIPAAQKRVVEVGIGNGLQLFERAQANPQHGFVGVEVYKNGLRSVLGKIEQTGLHNIKLASIDAREVLEALPAGSIDQLVVLYPDPWPKKKHNKRRIVQQDFLNSAARLLKPGGELFCATDMPDYALWILREVYTHGGFNVPAASPLAWATPPTWWVSTKYEQKALREGRQPWYFSFIKKDD